MSDVGGFELEDFDWEFGDSDDHIVPCPGLKKSGSVVERDSFKRLRTERKCAESNAESGHSADSIIGWQEEDSVEALKRGKETMLEKSPWSHSSTGSLSAVLDDNSNREGSRATSDEKWTSKQCLRSSNMNSDVSDLADDPILGDQTVHHQLNSDNRSEDDLTFLGDGLEDKDSHDLLFYDWPAFENFEDVDNLFRGCDSTLGLQLDDDDDLSWFTSSHANRASDDALKSSFDFSGLDPCGPNIVIKQQGLGDDSLVATESAKKLTPVSCKTDFQNSIPSLPPSVMNSYSDESTKSQLHVSPSKHQKSSEEKGKDWPLEDDVSYIQFDNGDNNLLNPQHRLLVDNSQGGEICHQMQMPMPMISSNYHPSNSVQSSLTPPVVKSDCDGLSSVTLMQSGESFRKVSIENPTFSGNKKKDRHHQRRLARHTEKPNFKVQRAASSLKSSKKPICSSENEAEGQSEVEGNYICIPGELDSCTRQESSCLSSVSDEVSVDARSLQQLQHVMEKLDTRTKLCIRDSLYRLAKSAEQRHKCFNQTNGRAEDENDNGALLSDGTNKCAGFIDMETDTNPIDRSIAHLLFHRPSDPSTAATTSDAVALKSHTKVPATNRDPLTSDKPVYIEETTSTNEEAAEHLKRDKICAN